MFDSLGISAELAYQMTIAALVVFALIQLSVLRREHAKVAKLQDSVKFVAKLAQRAIISSMGGFMQSINKSNARIRELEHELMEAKADLDDARDNARGRTTGDDIETIVFGDSHFANLGRGNHDRNGKRDQLSELFAMLDGKGRNGAALDDLLFGSRGRVVHGGDLVHGGPFNDTLEPGERNLTLDDLKSAAFGDVSEMERKLGAKVVEIAVIGQDGKEIVGAEKNALLRDFFGAGGPQPSFDPVDIGTSVHEALERDFHFGDRTYHPGGDVSGAGADTLKASLGGEPDESCSTQQPHSYASSSPRAG